MKSTSINIISYSPAITKVRRAASTKAILIGLALSIIGCGQGITITVEGPEVDKRQLELHQNKGQWFFDGKPFDGFAVTYFSNGRKSESVGYLNGKKEGLARKWYEDGTLRKESNYRGNRLEGRVKAWWPNGNLAVESNYENGQRHGSQRKWFANGQLARLTNRFEGKEKGLQQAWLPNGKIYVNYEARNGRSFGLRKATLCYELDDEMVQIKR